MRGPLHWVTGGHSWACGAGAEVALAEALLCFGVQALGVGNAGPVAHSSSGWVQRNGAGLGAGLCRMDKVLGQHVCGPARARPSTSLGSCRDGSPKSSHLLIRKQGPAVPRALMR